MVGMKEYTGKAWSFIYQIINISVLGLDLIVYLCFFKVYHSLIFTFIYFPKAVFKKIYLLIYKP